MKSYWKVILLLFLFVGIAYGVEVIPTMDGKSLPSLNEELRNVKESSTDGTLADNSDNVVPTEKAVKTYVDSAIPSGVILMWSGSESNIPSGWVLCDGNNGTPDLRNRFIIGAGDTYTEGDTGGATTHTMTEAEMPSHTHSISGGSHSHTASSGNQSASHSHTFSSSLAGFGGANVTVLGGAGSTGTGNQSSSHSHTITVDTSSSHSHTIGSTGSGDAFTIMNPYYALCYIMKE